LRIIFDDSLYGSLTRRDVLLRDPFTAEPVPRTRWSFGVIESNGRTVMTIKVKGAQPAGLYQMQINPGRIADDSGNRNPKRIRFNFMHHPLSDFLLDVLAIGILPEFTPHGVKNRLEFANIFRVRGVRQLVDSAPFAKRDCCLHLMRSWPPEARRTTVQLPN